MYECRLAFLPGTPGALEILVIFVVILLLFGPRKLPEIARSIGRTLHELRRASDNFRSEIMNIDAEPPRAPAIADGPPHASEGVSSAITGEISHEAKQHQAAVAATESPVAEPARGD
jgi:sec-independent protein translocase protein TatA